MKKSIYLFNKKISIVQALIFVIAIGVCFFSVIAGTHLSIGECSMAAIIASYPLDQIVKSTQYGNTGTHQYRVIPNRIIGAILVPYNFSVSAANLLPSAFLAYLQAQSKVADPTARIYPIYRLTLEKDDTKETTFADMGYEVQQPVIEGKPTFSFRILNADVEMNASLRLFNTLNGSNLMTRVIFIDSNQVLLGTNAGTAGTFTGFAMTSIQFEPYKINDGKTPTTFRMKIALEDPKDMNDNLHFVQMTVNVESNVLGCINAIMTNLTPAVPVSHEVTITGMTNQGAINLFTAYSTLLATKTLWSFTDSVTGADVSADVTSVTANATLGGWDVLFTMTMTNPVNIALKDPTTLATAHIGEAPSNPIDGTVPIAVTVT